MTPNPPPIAAHIVTSAGAPFPLGATPVDGGVNFAVVADGEPSRNGGVQLCLFETNGTEHRVDMTYRTAGIWHCWIPGLTAGIRYGYRVAAVDQSKVLLDPYARRVDRTDYDLVAASTPGVDTAGRVPLGIVTIPVTARSQPVGVPWEHTVLYEAHLKGMTAAHPAIPPELRGTYAGFAHPAMLGHLKGLGVTSVELLPVHAHAAEPLLAGQGRENYWGYSTLGYFALEPSYASAVGGELEEFVDMVDALHAAGLEVILDMVYNHTCEGGPNDPVTLSWRGLSPGTYYLPNGHDLTGTGNTIDSGTLPSVRMIVDSLRYFAEDLAVDGFRFDLAPTLGRPGGGPFDAQSGLLTAIAADPVLRRRKLIAEPWDATADGYALGQFGADFAEWNDRFRGTVRDFWRGAVGVRDLAYRLSGSEDVFGSRQPWASINFVTAHDGFTLRDLVSYKRKHNDANGQDGSDGTEDHRSANYGKEGDGTQIDPLPTAIADLRQRQARNLAATLLLATGTPMICAGDELWRTQRGNNNPYNIDSPITWIDWTATTAPGSPSAQMRDFFARVLAIRAAAPALHQGNFFSGRSPRDDGAADLTWFGANGETMAHEDWFDPDRRLLAAWFDGSDVTGHGPHGGPLSDDSWLIVLHADGEDTDLTLPGLPYGDSYTPVIDTAEPTGKPRDTTPIPCGASVTMPGRTLWLLRARRPHSVMES